METTNREVNVQRPYRHFKGKLDYVHDVMMHTETGERLAYYQDLYEPYDMFVRPLNMFIEKVDSNRKDNITKQTYRFELFDGV